MKLAWRRPTTGLVTIAACASLTAACAAAPTPGDKLARGTAAVRSAEIANADHVPEAQLYLQSARAELAQGKSLVANGDNERAVYVLLRAEADAEAAMSLAREADAKKDAVQTMHMVQTIKSQLEVPKS
jgi:hypothetical protein